MAEKNPLLKLTTAKLQAKSKIATGEEKQKIDAILKARKNKKSDVKKINTSKIKKGDTVTFKSRNGSLPIKGEVIRMLVGKKDGKNYVGVKHKNKMYYKQEAHVESVEKLAKVEKPAKEPKEAKA